MLVRDILYKDLISVSEHTTIRNLLRLLILNRISIVPVVNQLDEYLGCVSDKVILDMAMPKYMESMNNTSFLPDIDLIHDNLKNILDRQVHEVMPKDYPTVKLSDNVTYVADIMNKSGVREVPVVEGAMLIGKVHRIDILASCLK